ncbi:MAG: hypothetical protein HQK83_18860 [Fibrobacteria bacterium]|nr:hypothetical protein [Fibrobacteria bacterium]
MSIPRLAHQFKLSHAQVLFLKNKLMNPFFFKTIGRKGIRIPILKDDFGGGGLKQSLAYLAAGQPDKQLFQQEWRKKVLKQYQRFTGLIIKELRGVQKEIMP